MSSSEHPVVVRIAEALGEHDAKPLHQLTRLVALCGSDFAEFMLDYSQQVEAHGGLTTSDGARRRTPGGTYFYLVRCALPQKLRLQVFPMTGLERTVQAAKPRQPRPPFEFAKRAALLRSLVHNTGEAKDVNVTLKGRPGPVKRFDQMVAFSMMFTPSSSLPLPRGLPPVPKDPVHYTVYMSMKHWRRVQDEIKDPGTQLNIDGLAIYDPTLKSMVMYARSVLVVARKERAPRAGGAGVPAPTSTAAMPTARPSSSHNKPDAARPRAAKPDAPSAPARQPALRSARTQMPKPATNAPVEAASDAEAPDEDLTRFPAEVAAKLRPLYGARRMFRKRLADIDSDPESTPRVRQLTVTMLERAEEQIAALEAQARQA